MFVIESNANAVKKAIEGVFKDIPRAVKQRQGGFRRIIARGVDQHFTTLGLGGAMKVLGGGSVQWKPLSSTTVSIRKSIIDKGGAAAGVGPTSPILQLTGAMRSAARNGFVLTHITAFEGHLSFVPAGEEEKFREHGEGASGRFGAIPARPVLFWDASMGDRAIELLMSHTDAASRKRGFT